MDKVSGNSINYGMLVAVFILIIYTISEPLFKKLNFHYLHESGMCMIIGFVFSLIDFIYRPNKDIAADLKFDENVFFNLILPPIIFAAGYNLKRKGFYKYFLYIMSFGLIGTIINFLLVVPLTYICNQNGLFYISNLGRKYKKFEVINPNIYNEPLKLGLNEIILFSSVISATDTVAALTFVSEGSDPKLFAILFGEGVVNDAVCIVLYKVVFKILSESNEGGKNLN